MDKRLAPALENARGDYAVLLAMMSDQEQEAEVQTLGRLIEALRPAVAKAPKCLDGGISHLCDSDGVCVLCNQEIPDD